MLQPGHQHGKIVGTLLHFVYGKGILESTLPNIVHWKGTQEGTSSCYITVGASKRALLWQFQGDYFF